MGKILKILIYCEVDSYYDHEITYYFQLLIKLQ